MLTISCLVGLIFSQPLAASDFGGLFGYSQVAQKGLQALPQWSTVLEAQADSSTTRNCPENNRSKSCHADDWQRFLNSITHKSAEEQLDAVNQFVNAQDYVGDQTNYGQADYWALPGQFMRNGGDCEDYAIMKFFSLRALGWPADSVRVVVVQDTKLKQQHAVLAVESGNDILILDNQNKRIRSQKSIPHYAPVVSMTDNRWWLHLPDSQMVVATR